MYALLGKKAVPRVIPPPPGSKRLETPVEVDAELIEDEPVAETSSACEPEPTSAEPTSAELTSAEPTSAEPTSAEPTSAEPPSAEPPPAEPPPPPAEPTSAEAPKIPPPRAIKLPPPPPPPPRSFALPPASVRPPVSSSISGSTSIPPIAFDNAPASSAPRPKRAPRIALLSAAALGILVVSVFAIRSGLAAASGKLAASGGGTLVISVAGPSGKPIDGPRVLADGKLACESSPCRISNLKDGTHFVQVEAPGYAKTAPRAILVDAEKEAAAHIELSPEAASTEAATAVRAPSNALAEPASAADFDANSLPTRASAKNELAAATPKKSGSESAALITDGTVSITTTPSAKVVIDGKPIGSTPLSAVRLHPGPHSIVFIHPELGRKATAVSVTPGGTSSVNMRL